MILLMFLFCRNCSKRLYCSICRKPHASIGCFKPSCRKNFHFPCAIGNSRSCVVDPETFLVACLNHRDEVPNGKILDVLTDDEKQEEERLTALASTSEMKWVIDATEVSSHGDARELARQLVREVCKLAHAPVSHYHVGAALLGGSGAMYLGVNVELGSMNDTIHAEQFATGTVSNEKF